MSSTSEKVLQWLSTTGFPLEMRTASAFLGAGFEVTQSYMYGDPQSEKAREIDVFAREPDYLGVVDIIFVLECKSSSKPWVILLPDQGGASYNPLLSFAVTSGPARARLAERVFDGTLPNYVRAGEAKGYGLRQAFVSDVDPGFNAGFALLKACAVATRNNGIAQLPRHAIAFPILVVDTPLFECKHEGDGRLMLSEVNSSSFLFVNNLPEHLGCKITVVTKDHLPSFAREAKAVAAAIRQDFKAVQDQYLPSQSSQPTDQIHARVGQAALPPHGG
jgi:hypothetical protein